MGAGKYDTWLQVYRMQKPETQDTFGASVSEPELYFETWGAFEPAGTREFPESQKRHAETTARFRIPWPDDPLDPARDSIDMIFDEESSPPMSSSWNILGAIPDKGQRFELVIECSEII